MLSGPSTWARRLDDEGLHPVPSGESSLHQCREVEANDAGYVLVCTCGWRSPVERTAAIVGHNWDLHRGGEG